ncbi:SRPBCC family protein [Actinomycetospora lutea]|uniref:SRPBCC family protein n=1 Tax=Actinomycetospora lutea TaxID=663604 RepID=UPI0023657BD5|nr:SRPBCC family protein [Actinomycetospora lutea]MDD7937926.1 SRPBCC family protein [Actinomycetospora lutea]
MTTQTRLVSTVIARPWTDVYAYASDPRHLADWAAGLARAQVEPAPDRPGTWIADSPMGRVEVTVAPENDLGVLDYVVRLPDGTEVPNPLRVVPLDDGAEVVFHVRRREGMSEDDFAADAEAVARDLETLRRILETD